MKRTGEFFWVGLFIFVAAASSVSQTILYALRTPEGTVYPLVHNYPEDFYYYLHLMRQGWEGAWTATSRLTPEVFEGVFVNGWFLLLGHAARVTGISLPVMYTLTRVAGALALLVLSYLLILLVYPQNYKKRFVALLFVLFGSYWWGWNRNGPVVAPLVHQWTELDPLFRLSFIPHHLWSKVFMVAAYILIVYRLFPFTVFVLPFIVVVMGFTNPVAYATFVPTLVLYLLLSLARGGLARLDWRVFVAIGITIAVSFYHRFAQSAVFPWTSYLSWETVRYAIPPGQYLGSFGPVLFLAALAAGSMLHGKSVHQLLLAWSVSGFLMLFVFSPLLPLTNSRYLGGYQFIPIGIAAAEGVWMVSRRLRAILLVAVVFSGAVSWAASVREHVSYIDGNSTNPMIYVQREFFDVLKILENRAGNNDVVLAPPAESTMIPAFSRLRVVAGHQMMTLDYKKKAADVRDFYASGDPARMSAMISRYRLRYVIRAKGAAGLAMTKIYDGNVYEVYTVDKTP